MGWKGCVGSGRRRRERVVNFIVVYWCDCVFIGLGKRSLIIVDVDFFMQRKASVDVDVRIDCRWIRREDMSTKTTKNMKKLVGITSISGRLVT